MVACGYPWKARICAGASPATIDRLSWCDLHHVIAGAVLADVGLLWQNCRTFNAEGSDIAAMADEAEAHFVQLWAKKELPFESADVPGGGSEPQKHATLQTPPGASHRTAHAARMLNIEFFNLSCALTHALLPLECRCCSLSL